jgi:putative exosortase-associated protein (TIGR04073 family)
MRKTEEAQWRNVARVVMAAACVLGVAVVDERVVLADDVVVHDVEHRGVVAEEYVGRDLVTGDAIDERSSRHEDDVACDAYPSREPEVDALEKLGRGLHNLVFGFPAEVVRTPVNEMLKADTIFGFGAGAFEGVIVGVGKGFWRVGAGFLDIVTFPVPTAPWYDCDHLPKYPF